MPIYQYICRTETDRTKEHRDIVGTPTCGHEYEVFYTSFGAVEREEAGELCPKCGGAVKQRSEVPTATSFILKGRGWAKTKYE